MRCRPAGVECGAEARLRVGDVEHPHAGPPCHARCHAWQVQLLEALKGERGTRKVFAPHDVDTSVRADHKANAKKGH